MTKPSEDMLVLYITVMGAKCIDIIADILRKISKSKLTLSYIIVEFYFVLKAVTQ